MKKTEQAKFIEKAMKRYTLGRKAVYEQYKETKQDLLFKIGDQWDDEAKKARQGRPMLTINNQPQFVKSVVNDWRQSRPGIRVRPKDSKGSKELAGIIAGHIRDIENDSNAEIVYDNCMERIVDGGFGFFRVGSKYESDDSFNQTLVIKDIRDRFSVTLDPNAKDYHKADGMWAFVEAEIPKEDFEAKYPDASAGWGEDEYNNQEWCTDKNSVKIAEYYYVEYEKKKLALFSDGSVQDISDAGKTFIKDLEVSAGLKLENTRDVEVRKVKWAKITAHDVLEQADIPGELIPIIPVYGDVTYVDGRDYTSGVIRYNRDSARIQNYMASTAVESVALAPKRPVIITTNQIQGHEAQWKQWPNKPLPYLLTNDVPGATDPKRLEPDTSAGVVMQMAMAFSEQMKETSGGINKATLGQASNESSGVAINERKQQGQTSTYNYGDNMNRGIQFCGRVILSMYPFIYDTEREVQVVGEDGEMEQAVINNSLGENDVTKGKYEVLIEAGAAHATKRAESVNTLSQVIPMIPDPAAQMALIPVLLKNMDLEGADDALQAIESMMGQGGAMDAPNVQGAGIPGMPPLQ